MGFQQSSWSASVLGPRKDGSGRSSVWYPVQVPDLIGVKDRAIWIEAGFNNIDRWLI